MNCTRCAREIGDNSTYCAHCGASQQAGAGPRKRLERSVADRRIGGVCAGLGAYLDLDPALVRVLWIVLSVIPGAVVFGIVGYVAGWVLIPEAGHEAATGPRRRLVRSATDVKLAGVCGGIAEYFQMDSTPVRVLWVVLSICPGAIVGGVIVYTVAWLVMPAAPFAPTEAAPPPPTPPPAAPPAEA